MDPLRDRVFGLLSDLCGRRSSLSSDNVRSASHALLDVARSDGAESVVALADMLPWAAALVALCEESATPREVADRLVEHGDVRALTSSAIARRLERADRERSVLGAHKLERDTAGRRAVALRDLLALDRKLVGFVLRSDEKLRRDVLDRPSVLAAAVEVTEDRCPSEPGRRLRETFPAWHPEVQRPRGPALSLLADLETAWDGGQLRELIELSEDSRRYELSAVGHLRRNDFIHAVRATLAFGPMTAEESIDAGWKELPMFRDDAPLRRLTSGLMAARWICVEHVVEDRSIDRLTDWFTYLAVESPALARSRSVREREAISFALLCLHAVNFCDLAAYHPGRTDERRRRRLLDVEKDIKELARSDDILTAIDVDVCHRLPTRS